MDRHGVRGRALWFAIGAIVMMSPATLAAPAAAASPGTISTVAGGVVPGPVAATSLGQEPVRIATATLGGVTYTYVADESNHVVTRINDSDGSQTLIAGVGAIGFSGDGGPATSAEINPEGIAVDGAGDVFIADGGTRVRFVPAASGTFFGQAMTAGSIYTIAGNGTAGFGGDSGLATSAEIHTGAAAFSPGASIAVDAAGDLAIADSQNNRVRFVPIAGGIFFGVSMTVGDIYTVAGDGTGAFGGDSGVATAAELNMPLGVALDPAGDLAIADTQNERVRFVPISSNSFFGAARTAEHIYTVAGDGTAGLTGTGITATSTHLDLPLAVSFGPSGGIAITNPNESTITFVADGAVGYFGQAMATGDIYWIAGDETSGFSGDNGLATGAQLEIPLDASIDSGGNLLVADTSNERVRFVPAASGTFFGAPRTANDIYTVAGNGSAGFSGDGSSATASELSVPVSVAADPLGGFAIADFFNNRIRFVATTAGAVFGQAMTGGDMYTIAGDGNGSFGGDGGLGSAAQLNEPGGVGFDKQGDAVIADRFNNRVRFMPAASGTFFGQAMIAAHIYTIAGNGTGGFSGDGGPGTSAEVKGPTGVAIDPAGDVLIADADNNRVRFLPASSGSLFGQSMTAGDIYTIAGNGTAGFSGDGGPATSAELHSPEGVAEDPAGDVFFSDGTNQRVRLIPAASKTLFGQAMTAGDIYTIAGNGTAGFGGDGGPVGLSELHFPDGLAIDSSGDLAIADEANNRVRFVPATSGAFFGPTMTAGDIYTIAGDGAQGFSGDGGPAASAALSQPGSVTFDGSGDVLVADTSNNRIRLVTGTIPGPQGVGGGGPPGGPPGGGPGRPSNRFVVVSIKVKRNGDLVLVIRVPGQGRLRDSAAFTIARHAKRSGTHRKRKLKTLVVGYGHSTGVLKHAGLFTSTIKAGKTAKRDLLRLHKVRLTLAVTFTPTGGTARTQTYRVTVKRSKKGRFSK